MADGSNDILQIKTVTLRYSRAEDRICMAAVHDDNPPLALWLTTRMCRHIVKALVSQLEKGENTAPVDKSLAMTCRQHAAEWQQQSQQQSNPVILSGTEQSVCLQQVTIHSSKNAVALQFPLNGKKSACLTLNQPELRLWLGILYRQCILAEWPLDSWPEWFKNENASRIN
jgi:hypothetical protein